MAGVSDINIEISRRPDVQFDQFGRMLNYWIDNADPKSHILHPGRLRGVTENAYLQDGVSYRPPARYFSQRRYKPLPGSIPDLDLALDGAVLDCGQDVHRLIYNAGGAIKLWMSIRVRYESISSLDDAHHGFDTFLSYSGARFFLRQGPINHWENPYGDAFQDIIDGIKAQNAKYLRDKSGLALTAITELTLRALDYNPVGGGCHRELPEYLKK